MAIEQDTPELPTLALRSGRRIRGNFGHPWVFAGDLAKPLESQPPKDAATLLDARGNVLGSGVVNLRSQLIWRRYSRHPGVPFDESCIRSALTEALARRDLREPYQRLCFSDADDLPGFIADRFGDVIVVQALTLAVEQRLPLFEKFLRDQFPDTKEFVYRNDAPSRKLEGLSLERYTSSGSALEPAEHEIEAMRYRLDLLGAQKTGFYLDQLPQHRRVAEMASGRRVLDACCFQGSFSLHCARAGAESVTAVDVSADCVAATAANAQRNGLEVDAREANVFDFLRNAEQEGVHYDLIVLDPPSFAPNKRSIEGGLRGYNELNFRAMKLLSPGGLLATYSCSQHVGPGLFMEMLSRAASDVKPPIRLIEEVRQPADHPVRLDFPESLYLNGAILEVG